MAKAKDRDPPHVDPLLRLPRTKAEALILKQIQAGESFLSKRVRSEEDLSALRDLVSNWYSFNERLLLRIFTTTEIAERYIDADRHALNLSVGPPTLDEEASSLERHIKSVLQRLNALHEQLPLFEENQPPAPDVAPKAAPKGKSVFIVHGHDAAIKQGVARFVERLKLKAVILHELPNKGRTIIEKFEEHAAEIGFAVALLTADDVGAPKAEPAKLRARARQNVIFELGFFAAKLGRQNVCALVEDGVEILSDYSGVLYIPIGSGDSWHLPLAKELKAAKLDVDLNDAV